MSSAGGFGPPRRLWSLWDTMHKLKSDLFFKAYEHATAFHQTLSILHGNKISMPKRDLEEKITRFDGFATELTALGLTGAALCVARTLEILRTGSTEDQEIPGQVVFSPQDAARLQNSLSQCTSRIPDDLTGQVLLALDPRRSHLYQDPRPFGDEVFEAFSAARMDIEDAAKCLSLERGTACVFHIMRALEGAASVIADKIGAAIQDQYGRGLPWGVIADNMKPKIDAMARGSEEQISWYRVQQDLVVINRAWRVPTNHPKESYSPDEAQEIFDATKAFMKELASLA
jgi:hypothetical protein